MTDPVDAEWPTPAFRVPFDEEQLVLMGLIAVVWGQIDFWINQIIQSLHGIDYAQRKLLLGDKTIGPKLDLITKSLDRVADDAVREAIRQAVAATRTTLERRNAAAHGMWGFWTGVEGDPVPAVQTRAGVPPVLRAEDLRQLYADVADASALVDAAFCSLSGLMAHTRGRKIGRAHV